MMGERLVQRGALFYEFSLERHVPEKHLLRAIDRFVDLDGVRAHLVLFYSETGRPSIDPELLTFCDVPIGAISKTRFCSCMARRPDKRSRLFAALNSVEMIFSGPWSLMAVFPETRR